MNKREYNPSQVALVNHLTELSGGPSAYPILKPHLRYEIIPPKTVYLIGEYGSSALNGELYCKIVPLLDGTRTVEDIFQALNGEVPLDHVQYVLDRLRTAGFVVDAALGLSHEATAFWTQLGVEPQLAVDRLARAKLAVTVVGATEAGSLIAELKDLGLNAVETDISNAKAVSKDLLIAVVDDYCRPELKVLNRDMLATDTPWVLVKPVGSIIWLGPMFVPSQTGCFACLSHRLKGNDEVRGTILRQRSDLKHGVGQANGEEDVDACLPLSVAALLSTRKVALALAATEIAKAVILSFENDPLQIQRSSLQGTLVTFDMAQFSLRRHAVPHRPQCPECGNPNLLTQRGYRPVELNHCPKNFTRDGGHRTVTPEQTLARFEHLIDPLTGIVSELTRVSASDNNMIHNYISGRSLAGQARSLENLKRALVSTNAGKGKTDAQSRASGFCEAIERYSGVYQGDEPRQRASYEVLGDDAIHPESYLCFSDFQYANREELNRNRLADNAWIPQRMDPTREIDWTPVWSLTHQRFKFFPTALGYYGVPTPGDHRFAYGDSNGCAAGNTIEEATLQGFLELIERDSLAIWWYNQIRRPSIDLASFNEPYFLELRDYYQRVGRDIWVLDITGEFGIPSFVAVSRRTDVEEDRIIIRFGAHLDAKLGVERALTEMNQGCSSYDGDMDARLTSSNLDWLLSARIDDHPYLLPASNLAQKTAADYPRHVHTDIRDDITDCIVKAAQLGLETFLLDQTRPDIGLNVVKVIVPGLRHYWPRLGHGRLYDAPVRLGWRTVARNESEINPTPIPAF